jgi:hypothetical protein
MSNQPNQQPVVSAETIFAMLFRQLREQLVAEGVRLETLVIDALRKQHPDTPDVNLLPAKHNLLRVLTADTMNANVFFKGLKVLGADSVGFHVTTSGPEGQGAAAHESFELK